MTDPRADIGLIGLAVMGENLVLNFESRGFRVAVHNRTVEKVDAFLAGRAKGRNVVGARSVAELVAAHAKPADEQERAFLMELVLEGLVQSLRIAREDLDSTVTYVELARLNLMRGRG